MHQAEAVAIVRLAVLRRARGELPGIPAAKSIRLSSDGSVTVGEPIPVGSDLERAGALLEALLTQAAPYLSSPSALRLILGRAYARDAAAFGSLGEFADALTPFGASDPAAVVRDLVARCPTSSSQEPEPVHQLPSAPSAQPVTLRPAPDRRRRSVTADVSDYEPPNRLLWIAAAASGVVFVVLLGSQWMTRQQPEQGFASRAVSTSPAPPSTAETVAPPSAADPTQSEVAQPSAAISAPVKALALPRLRETPTSRAETADTGGAFSPAFATVASAMFLGTTAEAAGPVVPLDARDDGRVLRIVNVRGDRGSNFHPRPSPDGRLIAFDSDRDGERGIYVANADGSAVRRISGDGFAAIPSWSPDGGRIAFARAEPGRPRVWNLWIVDVTTGESVRVTNHSVGQPWGAAWFPDGTRIAYSHEERLIVQPLDGGEVKTFNSPIRGRFVRTPAVSPDGTKIMFHVHRDGAWMLDLADDSMRRILDDPSVEEFTWSPDGRRVAYHSRRSGEWGVWMMAPR